MVDTTILEVGKRQNKSFSRIINDPFENRMYNFISDALVSIKYIPKIEEKLD